MDAELRKRAEKDFNIYCLSELLYYQIKLAGSENPLQDIKDALEIAMERLVKEGAIPQ